MKANFLFLIVLVGVSLLVESCGSVVVPPASSTLTPEPTVIPSPTVVLPTLPSADAVVTFTGGTQCSYNGPKSIPAVEEFTINLYIHSTTSSYYMFLATILEEGRTKEELIKEIKNPLPPPSWSTGAGTFEVPSGTSSQIVLNLTNKSFYGPLYFICMSGSRDKHDLLEVLGPFEIQ